MAIIPAKTQTTSEKGPRELAPKLEATYVCTDYGADNQVGNVEERKLLLHFAFGH
jgi:hypothetical protein